MSDIDDLHQRVTDLEEKVERLLSIMNDRPRSVFMMDVIRWRVPRELPMLLQEFPDGPTTQDIAKRFNLTQGITIAGLRYLVAKGKIQLVRLKRSSKWVVLPPGYALPGARITPAQERLLQGLKRLAGGGRTIRTSTREMARVLSVHPSTVNYQLKGLIELGCLVLETAGSDYEPSTYRFPVSAPVVSDAEVWKAAFKA